MTAVTLQGLSKQTVESGFVTEVNFGDFGTRMGRISLNWATMT